MSKETKECLERLDWYDKWIAMRWKGLTDFMKDIARITRHDLIMQLQAQQLKEFNHE